MAVMDSKPKIAFTPNGPYYLMHDMQATPVSNLRRASGEACATVRGAALCRCGASKNKPFCDASHLALPFTASGEPPTQSSEALKMRNGPLLVSPTANGPLDVRGNLEICSGTGRTVARVERTRLCRCGGSANKPFCDGTHARIGFRSDDPPGSV